MDIGAWLQGLGLQQYEPAFRSNDIDADVLLHLTEADLERLGMSSLGHRKKLLAAILDLRSAAGLPNAPPHRDRMTAAGPAPVGAERRQLTVMFCDLVDSTALAVRLDPEDFREIIGTYQRCVADAVHRYDGYVAKYMGDGVLIYFGYPKAHEDDAERAVRAGLGLAEAIRRLRGPGGSRLQVRIGIATGLVVVGDLLGAGEAREYGVVGETPNLAARLQSLAEPGAVVIAPSTRQLVEGLFACRALGAIEIKGFAEPVNAWHVLHPSSIASRSEAVHETTALAPLIGRAEELDLLLRRWEQAQGGEGRVLLISGEPGIGKSRLTAALEQRLHGEPHYGLSYFCSPHHAASAFHPIIVQLEHAAGFERDDTPRAKLHKLEALLAPASTPAQHKYLLAELLGLPTDGLPAPPELSPQKRKERTYEVLMRQIEFRAGQTPVLMLFEDTHWSDPTSLDFLSLVVERSPNLSILLIVTYRPEFQPSWIGQAHVTALSLNRLGHRPSAEIVERVTEGKSLPPEVLEQIVAHADGIPLFVEELTKTVLESGALRLAGQGYRLTATSPHLAVPSTLHASLMARLDRLADIKEIAQIGAAIGREFSFEVLAAVGGQPAEMLSAAMARLVEAELVFQRGAPPDAVYSFKHALVQDAAYGTLLRGKRQQIHTRIKEALEEHWPELCETQPEILAHHCAQAGLIAEAIDYWERSGRRAAAKSANREAVAHFQRALELVPLLAEEADRTERELRILMALGPALVSTRPSADPEVDRVYARAHRLAREAGRSAELFPAVWGSWMFAYNSGDLPTAARLGEELFGIARAENDEGFLLQAHHAMWPIDVALSRFVSARRHIESGLALYRPERHGKHALIYGGHDPGVCGYTLDALILATQGYLDQAVERSETGLALARELSHPPSLIQALAFAADIQLLRRNPAKVQQCVEALLPLAKKFGSPVSVANATMLQGWALIVRGDLSRGVAELRAGLEAWCSTGSKFHKPYRLGRAADALCQAGEFARALQLLQEGLQDIEHGGDRWFKSELHRLKGEVLLRTESGNSAEAEACFDRALLIAREQGTRLFELRASVSLARLWTKMDRPSEALAVLGQTCSRFTEALDASDLQEAKTLLDEISSR